MSKWTKKGEAYTKMVGPFKATLWPIEGIWRIRLSGACEHVFEPVEGTLSDQADEILVDLLMSSLESVVGEGALASLTWEKH